LPGVNGIADAARGSALPLVALGPWLLLQMLIFQNVARLASIENWGLLGSSTLLVLGNAVVLWLATKYAGQKQHPLTALAAGLLYLLALWLREDVNGVLLGQIIGAYLLFSLLRGLGKPDPDSNLKRLNIGNGLGQMLFVIPTFLYYVSYDLDLGFRSGVVPLALGVV
ncbi:MAG: hypothetical protein GY797_34405, partial [Deltaproteobacteria bacterium]|nr:hypothetical protein [Deltaproteobacteria bacterium]